MLSLVSLSEALLLVYLGYKVSNIFTVKVWLLCIHRWLQILMVSFMNQIILQIQEDPKIFLNKNPIIRKMYTVEMSLGYFYSPPEC